MPAVRSEELETQIPVTNRVLKMPDLKPMDAVAALYSGDDLELSGKIVASLSDAIFNGSEIRQAGRVQRTMARVSYRMLQWTTTSGKGKDEKGSEVTVFSNPVLERSRHPFARSLLGSSRSETASLMEGGDPMNGNYVMIAPEIRMNGGLWDRLFLGLGPGKGCAVKDGIGNASDLRDSQALARERGTGPAESGGGRHRLEHDTGL